MVTSPAPVGPTPAPPPPPRSAARYQRRRTRSGDAGGVGVRHASGVSTRHPVIGVHPAGQRNPQADHYRQRVPQPMHIWPPDRSTTGSLKGVPRRRPAGPPSSRRTSGTPPPRRSRGRCGNSAEGCCPPPAGAAHPRTRCKLRRAWPIRISNERSSAGVSSVRWHRALRWMPLAPARRGSRRSVR